MSITVVSCCAPYGEGGLGQHLAQVVDGPRAALALSRYYAASPKIGDHRGEVVSTAAVSWICRWTPVRFNQGWKAFIGCELFDRAVAHRIERGDKFHGFNGMALHSFRRARSLGYTELVLESATTHVNHVWRQQERVEREYGLERGWLIGTLRRKTLLEYEMADTIYVGSELTRQTFLVEGVPADKLRRRSLTPDPRFRPRRQCPDDGVLRVIYVGALTSLKGIPVLIEAFSRISNPIAELWLIGGWASRGMRAYLQSAMAADPRIRVAPGDPLPHLERASVFVHSSFADGFGLAPMEAMACGVPVIVTQDTGMKEWVREGINGWVVPTGDMDGLIDRLKEAATWRSEERLPCASAISRT